MVRCQAPSGHGAPVGPQRPGPVRRCRSRRRREPASVPRTPASLRARRATAVPAAAASCDPRPPAARRRRARVCSSTLSAGSGEKRPQAIDEAVHVPADDPHYRLRRLIQTRSAMTAAIRIPSPVRNTETSFCSGPASMESAFPASQLSTAVPGPIPSSVPSMKSRRRMCDAPATTLTMVNGATGTNRMAATVRMPCLARRRLIWFTRCPASRRTRSRPAKRADRVVECSGQQRADQADSESLVGDRR